MPPENPYAAEAERLFRSGFSCSQAVLAAFGPDLGLDLDLALRIAQPFGGGLAQTGRMCGAASGASLVIGLKYGRTKPEDIQAKEKTYDLVRLFLAEFLEAHGELDCPNLLGYDLSVPDEMKSAEDEGLFETLCTNLVRSAAEVLSEII